MNKISFYNSRRIALTPLNMKICDNHTIENGISGNELMLRASKSIYKRIVINFISNKSKNYICKNKNFFKKRVVNKHIKLSVTIVAGSGNNGGDGLALAYILKSKGFNVILYSENSKTDNHKHYLEKCKNLKIEVLPFSKASNIKSRIIVDCLFGIGFHGNVKDKYFDIIDFINSHNYIISADIASGLNAQNGISDIHHVNANETICMQFLKVGHILNDGLDCSGDIYVSDIGIGLHTNYVKIVDENMVKIAFYPLKRNIHKSSNGVVGIVANSDTCIGAGIFSYLSSKEVNNALDNINNNAEVSLISGAGLSKIFVPKNIIPQMLYKLNNAMVFPYQDFSNQKLSSIAYGMGVGEKNDMLKSILIKKLPTILDADAINILSKNENLLSLLHNQVIITPHPLEFSRLTKIPISEILSNPIEYSQNFAKAHNITVLLKGCTTIITNGEETYINIAGNPCMAKGGSGDLLSGVIAALLGRNIKPLLAGSIASFICGKSGERLSETYGEYSVVPLDYPIEIRETITKLLNN